VNIEKILSFSCDLSALFVFSQWHTLQSGVDTPRERFTITSSPLDNDSYVNKIQIYLRKKKYYLKLFLKVI
jgi:hypothetical protein